MTNFSKGALLAAALLLSAAAANAASCLDGGCHGAVIKFKFLHGPLALEQNMGGKGCVSCHKPSGKPCTAKTAGQYTYAEEKEKLCTLCHDKSESPKHIARTSGCLRCHSPHGSDKTVTLLRFDLKP